MRHQAIYNTHPNVKGIQGTGVCVDKDSNPVEIDETLVGPEIIRLQSEHDALKYARNRRNAYPDWQVQLNKIYDDGVDAWKTDMVDPIKTQFPKP